ncbi:Peroxidase 5, partial [Bienertia sinuspersici]
VEAQLNVGFYCKLRPSAERTVKEEVMKGFVQNRGIAPGLVRMHFHDCFVRPSEGLMSSTMQRPDLRLNAMGLYHAQTY